MTLKIQANFICRGTNPSIEDDDEIKIITKEYLTFSDFRFYIIEVDEEKLTQLTLTYGNSFVWKR